MIKRKNGIGWPIRRQRKGSEGRKGEGKPIYHLAGWKGGVGQTRRLRQLGLGVAGSGEWARC